eukprot:Skav206003  [mRNA]  locus=scaffold2084:460624:474964:- [translate_table: standard]
MLEFMGLAGNFGHLNLSDPFDVKKRRSSYSTEVRAGITTFLAMAYILPVNSGMLSLVIPGKREELVCATALAAFCGCWLMGILSNYPFMLAPGMGTNAFFTFTICLGRGLPYPAAFAAVFVAGCIFILLSVTGLRTLMIRLFPEGVKESMGLSIGDPDTLVTLNSLSPSNYDSAKLWLSIAVLCITATLFAAKVPGAPLAGILFGTAICWIEGFCRGPQHSVFGYPFGTDGDRSAKDFHIYVPSSIVSQPSLKGLSGCLWQGFGAAVDPAMAATFWTADLLDSSGTFFAVAKVAGLTDKRGNLPLARQNMAPWWRGAEIHRSDLSTPEAYLADAIAALIGSMLGVSTVATFAESTAGVADGAKTGLASLVTGSCFLLAIPIAPVVSAVPPLASGPILVLLGALMCSSVRGIDWDDYQERPGQVWMGTIQDEESSCLKTPWTRRSFLQGREDPLVRCKALWAGVFVEGIEEGDTPRSDVDTEVTYVTCSKGTQDLQLSLSPASAVGLLPAFPQCCIRHLQCVAHVGAKMEEAEQQASQSSASSSTRNDEKVGSAELTKWKEMMDQGISQYMRAHPDRFHRRVRSQWSTEDVPRTFPDVKTFNEDQQQRLGDENSVKKPGKWGNEQQEKMTGNDRNAKDRKG